MRKGAKLKFSYIGYKEQVIEVGDPTVINVKMSEEDHKLYEQRRVLEPGCEEYNRILQLQLKLYSDMEYPENIADLEKI